MPYAIYTDLSGVAEVSDGLFPTELKALEALILHLESDKTEVTDRIARAKKRQRQINRRKT